LRTQAICKNCSGIDETVYMDSINAEGNNLSRRDTFKCPNCGNEVSVFAHGCITHLVAINKQSVQMNLNHEIGEGGTPIKITECDCPNCQPDEEYNAKIWRDKL